MIKIKHFLIIFYVVVNPSAHGVLRFRFELDVEIIIKAVIQIFLKSYYNRCAFFTNAVYKYITYRFFNTHTIFFFSCSIS